MTRKSVIILSLVLIAMAFTINFIVYAQSTVRINIDHIENGQFPLLEIYTSVTNVQGFPLKNLGKTDFSISEDNKPVTDFEITPIQNVQQSLAIVLAIDTSGSMGNTPSPTPLQNSIEAAKVFIDSLSPQDQIAVIGFADTPYLAQDFTQDKERVKTNLDTLAANGNTTLYDGIVEAVGLLKSRSERRILVVITDGFDSSIGNFVFDTTIDEATRWSIPVYPIGFGNVNRNELEQMAILTGGMAQIQPNSTDIQSAFSTILQVLREQYLIRYTSNLPADGTSYNLQIIVENQSAEKMFIALPRKPTISVPFHDGETVGGNLLFKPEVIAPAPLEELEILLDGNQLQKIFSEPFEYAWNSTTVSPGEHTFTFTIKDEAGNTAQSNVVLNIQPPITIKLIAPGEDQKLSGLSSVTVNVEALDGVAKVEYSVDNRPIQEKISPPFVITIDWDDYAKGPHVLQVKATDVNGFTDSKEVIIQVTGKDDIWFLILVIGVGLAALGIPIGLRRKGNFVVTPTKSGNATLREIQGSDPGKSWSLGTEDAGIGRKRTNFIQVKSLKASREQALIRYENGRHVLYNLREDNPPLVNNTPISEKCILQPGDEIRLGEDILRYEQ